MTRIFESKGFYVDEISEKGKVLKQTTEKDKNQTVKSSKAGWHCLGCGEWLAPPETPKEIVEKIQAEHNRKHHSGGVFVE